MVEETQNVAPDPAVAEHAAPTEAVAAEQATSPESEPTVLDLTETTVESESADPTSDAPDVDELELRLADLQRAMDQLQAGDLDGAEAAVEALEKQLAAARDGHQ